MTDDKDSYRAYLRCQELSIGLDLLWQNWLLERYSPDDPYPVILEEHQLAFFEEYKFVSYMQRIGTDRNYNAIIDSLS